MILKTLTVAGLATFEIYAAIPAGFAFGLSPWIIFFASLTGGIAGVFFAAFLGARLRAFLYKNKPEKTASLNTRWYFASGINMASLALGF